MSKKNTTKKQKNKKLIKKLKDDIKITKDSHTLAIILPLLIIISVIGLGFLVINQFRFQINPDATSYLQIAKKYAFGDIYGAINGYWSPLLSWLLIPFVWFGIDLQLGSKMIALFASLAILLIIWWIIYKQNIPWWISATIITITSVLLINWSLAGPITGDILFVLMGLLAVLAAYRFINAPNLSNTIYFAASGAFMYFSKAIGFYIFILFLITIFILSSKITIKKSKKYLLVLLIFGLMCLPFVSAISIKNKKPTLSTAQPYNLELAKHFDSSSNGYDHPMNWQNIVVPLKPNTYTMHEDPNQLTQYLKHQKPITRTVAIKNYIRNIINNLYNLFSSTFIVFVILGFVFLLKNDINKINVNRKLDINKLLALLGSIVILSSLVSIFEYRYIYLSILIGYLGLGVLIYNSKKIIYAPLCCLLLIFTITPTLVGLHKQSGINRDIYAESINIKNKIPKNSTTISDSGISIYYCYYGEFKCLGTLTINNDNHKQIKQIVDKNSIDYYIVTNPATLEWLKANPNVNFGVKVVTTFPTNYKY